MAARSLAMLGGLGWLLHGPAGRVGERQLGGKPDNDDGVDNRHAGQKISGLCIVKRVLGNARIIGSGLGILGHGLDLQKYVHEFLQSVPLGWRRWLIDVGQAGASRPVMGRLSNGAGHAKLEESCWPA